MCRSKWALVPLVLLLSLDCWFTLAGQPYSYWEGFYHHCNEGSPLGRWLLKICPWCFLTAYIGYALLVCWIAIWLRDPLGTAFIMGVILGHSWGSSSWLPSLIEKSFDIKLGGDGIWYLHILYYVLIATVCGIFLSSQKKKCAPKPSP